MASPTLVSDVDHPLDNSLTNFTANSPQGFGCRFEVRTSALQENMKRGLEGLFACLNVGGCSRN
jgi:hypothetical protein